MKNKVNTKIFRKSIIILGLVLFVSSVFAGRVVYITNYTKINGSKNWLGQERFAEVQVVTHVPYLANEDRLYIITDVKCEGAGHSKCKKKLENSLGGGEILKLRDDIHIDADKLDAFIDEACEYAETCIIDEIYSGKRHKTIVTYSVEGEIVYLNISVLWESDKNGTSKITVMATDITNEIPLPNLKSRLIRM